MTLRVDVAAALSCDIKAIYEIEKECIPGGWSERAFEEALRNPSAVILAARCDGEVIGFANGSFVLDEGELLNIAVRPEYRRKGVADMLYTALEKAFVQKGVTAVFLEVRESNVPAMEFYIKKGFEKNGLRKKYYSNPLENAVLMRKNI